MTRVWVRAAVSAVLVGLVLVGYLSYYVPIIDSYYPLNVGWNGCSQIYGMAQRRYLLESYSNTPQIVPSLIAIIGPRISFGKAESMKKFSFLEEGGTVLLADDYGTGNSLLENLNVSVRFAGQPLADLYFYSKTPSFPIISDIKSNSMTMNVTTVVMDRPSYLELTNATAVTILALSSPFSFVDLFNNGTLPTNENTQSYPVIAETKVGKGSLVLIANSYVFTNEIVGLFSNRVLFSEILKASNETAYFDVAHLKQAPLTEARIKFRDEFDSSVSVLHSTISQGAVTAVLLAVFCGVFIRERRVEKRSAGSVAAESTLHTNGVKHFGGW